MYFNNNPLILTINMNIIFTCEDLLTIPNHAALTLSRKSWVKLFRDLLIDLPIIQVADNIKLSETFSYITTVITPTGNFFDGILLSYTITITHPQLISTIIDTNTNKLKNNNQLQQMISILNEQNNIPIFNGKFVNIDSFMHVRELKETKPKRRHGNHTLVPTNTSTDS